MTAPSSRVNAADASDSYDTTVLLVSVVSHVSAGSTRRKRAVWLERHCALHTLRLNLEEVLAELCRIEARSARAVRGWGAPRDPVTYRPDREEAARLRCDMSWILERLEQITAEPPPPHEPRPRRDPQTAANIRAAVPRGLGRSAGSTSSGRMAGCCVSATRMRRPTAAASRPRSVTVLRRTRRSPKPPETHHAEG
jgi:hypothetical protein